MEIAVPGALLKKNLSFSQILLGCKGWRSKKFIHYAPVFHHNMDGVKIIAMLMAFWGFASYIYQNYLAEVKEE